MISIQEIKDRNPSIEYYGRSFVIKIPNGRSNDSENLIIVDGVDIADKVKKLTLELKAGYLITIKMELIDIE